MAAAQSWRDVVGSKAATPVSKAPVKKSNPLDYYMSKVYSSSDIKGRMIAIYGNEGVGKSVLAAQLGKSNLFISDDNGTLSLQNHPELDDISVAIPFEGYEAAIEVLDYVEAEEFIHPKTGLPVDNVILDTVSGMVSDELRDSIENRAIKAEGGKLADNIPTRPHYLLNEQNFGPLMRKCGRMRNSSVTLLSHLRQGTKDVPGASTRADLHGAAYKLMAKYSSVVAFMDMEGSNRMIRVMPEQMIGAKTRYNFGKAKMTDAEFVAKVEQWKLI